LRVAEDRETNNLVGEPNCSNESEPVASVDFKCCNSGKRPAETADSESMYAMIDGYLDLSLIHRLQKFDKFSYRILLAKVRDYFFGGANFTKERCENFFCDETNFA
jgi:hypothetical protein